MLFLNLPRFLWRAERIKLNYIKVLNSFWHITPKVTRMDRVEKILNADKDIEQKIMALRCEVTDVEAKILDNFLIDRLERENRELEEEIEKYRNELIQLEKLKGRPQVCLNANLESCEAQAKPIKIDEVHKQSQDPHPQDVAAPEVSSTKKGKKEKKNENNTVKKSEKSESKNLGVGEDPPINIGRLDLRVGKIVHIEKHPDADSLYVEKVDVGKPQPITVVSGLVKHIPINEMQDSLVVILCNLKPAKMRGVTSEGMVMCASSEGVVEVLRPPPDSAPGDVITCSGYNSNPDPVMNPKKKIFETVAPDLKTNDDLVATYKGAQWNVGSKGLVKAQSLKGANIK